ncbi:nucleotidyltransferase family protein [candidate division KSB1 bacterium]|nr:nucleotidyltransferase family protein [candidate division KSB1 bacterium]
MTAAMILCAGYGKRLQHLTKNIPKPMLPIDGKPLLEYTIRHLAGLGIDQIVINLHYLGDRIVSYFGDGSRWGISITYSPETKPLGTAGAVKNAQALLDTSDRFLVLYGDVICNDNYNRLLNRLNTVPTAIGAIVLHQRMVSNSIVEIDSDHRIVRFFERPAHEVPDKRQNWVNSGLYAFRPEIFDSIPAGEFADFPRDVFPQLVAQGCLYGQPLQDYRCAVDSPERYAQVAKDIREQNLFAECATVDRV